MGIPMLRMIALLALLTTMHCFNNIVLDSMSRRKPNLRPVSVYSEAPRGCFSPGASARILLLPVKGTIMSSNEQNVRDRVSPSQVAAVLEAAGRDKSIKTVLLQIDSPGGSVGASDLIYELIRKAQEKHNYKVYAHIDDLGASGGYYAAMAADYINARPTALVGSIGVIMRGFELTGLLDKSGIKYRTIQTGKNKDTLSPFREMTAEEKAYYQKEVEHSYERFLQIVKTGRKEKISAENLRTIADGRVMNANRARDAGLIDSTDYLEDYIKKIKERESMGSVEVVAYLPAEYSNYSLYDVQIGPPEQLPQIIRDTLRSQFGLFYIWEPYLN